MMILKRKNSMQEKLLMRRMNLREKEKRLIGFKNINSGCSSKEKKTKNQKDSEIFKFKLYIILFIFIL